MYLKTKVEVPVEEGKIVINRNKYVMYEIDRKYDKIKKYNVPIRVAIGRICEDGMMQPNANYLVYFYDEKMQKEIKERERSGCIRIGTYFLYKKIIEEKKLNNISERIFGDYGGLILDLATYMISTENNAFQYYEDFAYNHFQFSKGHKILSDSTISNILKNITDTERIEFLNLWNDDKDTKEKLYLTYDSTNKNCQSGNINLAEFGHAKDDESKPIINLSIGYDHNNREPLFYEEYPGSIVDVSQLTCMIDKAIGYGYKNIGIILDRGYFSRKNLEYIDQNGYDFIIMAKSQSKFIQKSIRKVIGTFEQDRNNLINKYDVYGKTYKEDVFFDDNKRYVHVYYNELRAAIERKDFEEKIHIQDIFYKKFIGTKNELEGSEKYFDIVRDKGNIITSVFQKNNVIQKEKELCGYFAIVTSKKMTAKEAIYLYKSRDESEKLFRMEKTFLGNSSYRVQSEESIKSKTLIGFIALIIRNAIYTYLDEAKETPDGRGNYMTVPAVLKELEKIEMLRQPNGKYVLDYAITATQSKILNAFGINPKHIPEKAKYISLELEKC